MRTEIKRGSQGNLILLVRFEEQDSFDSSDLTWVPRLEEIDRIQKLLNAVIDINKQADSK